MQPLFLSMERDAVLLFAKNNIATSQKAIRLNDVGAIFSDKSLPEFSKNEAGGQNINSSVHFPVLFSLGGGGLGGGWRRRNIYTHKHTHT